MVKKSRCTKKGFSSKDIKKIQNLTNDNFHGEAREFIARKVCSTTEKKFARINEEHIKVGSLIPRLVKRRDMAEQQLFRELRKDLSLTQLNKVTRAL